jgi:hypothetical protein
MSGEDMTLAEIQSTDAAGNDTSLGTAAKSVLDKQPIQKINMGFNTNFTYKTLI